MKIIYEFDSFEDKDEREHFEKASLYYDRMTDAHAFVEEMREDISDRGLSDEDLDSVLEDLETVLRMIDPDR